jgi:hypothetical protein
VTYAIDGQHATLVIRPLALNTHKLRPEIKDQVIPLISQWSEHPDAELDRLGGDTGLGNRSFLIRCHIRQPSDRIGWALSV